MRKKLCDYDYPSEKQLSYIGAIERRLDVLFTGKTKQEASEFISKYVDRFKAYNYTFERGAIMVAIDELQEYMCKSNNYACDGCSANINYQCSFDNVNKCLKEYEEIKIGNIEKDKTINGGNNTLMNMI